MFKLSIQFATLAALTSFVTKMGDDVQDSVVTHDQPLNGGAPSTGELTPAQKSAKTKADKKAAASVNTPPAVPQNNVVNGPFPGGFAPGGAPQAAPQLVHNAPTVGPASAPVVAPMAPVQAPAPTPIVQAPAAVSPERQQYNNNCAQLIQYLEQGGLAKGYAPEQLGAVIQNAMNEAGCTGKITELSDAQMVVFYPILHKHVLHAVPQA